MIRKIVTIDEEKCNGCGNCIPNCAEGALQIIDGKARLISDLFCDGLGACIGHCPEGAMLIEEREAEPYNERKVMETIIKGGNNVIKAHLQHLKEHNEIEYYNQAIEFLKENNIPFVMSSTAQKHYGGCPGSRTVHFEENKIEEKQNEISKEKRNSQLRQWPVQLHLLNPLAPYFRNADVLLASDCSAFTAGDFHQDYLKGKTLAIACPKLDEGQESYVEKISAMISESNIKSITVLIMEVPCCRGLLQVAQRAMQIANKQIPINVIVLSIKGEKLFEQQVA